MTICIITVTIAEVYQIYYGLEVSTITALVEARKARGMTQGQLSTASGVHRVTIARLENGKGSPNLHTLSLLAAALGIRVEDLIEKGV